MFKISVETCFRASHQLTLPDGLKEATHSHNWLVTANVSSNKLNAMGVVMDFHRLKATVDTIVAKFDNISINRTDYFQRNNPSAENVAKYIYNNLEPKLPKGLKLQSIKIEEEPGCAAEFTK